MNEYDVWVSETTVYKVRVTADSEDSARELAETNYLDGKLKYSELESEIAQTYALQP